MYLCLLFPPLNKWTEVLAFKIGNRNRVCLRLYFPKNEQQLGKFPLKWNKSDVENETQKQTEYRLSANRPRVSTYR